MGNAETYEYVNTSCRIVVVGPKSGDLSLTELRHLPKEARILGTGNNLEELRKEGDLFTEANILFNVTGNSTTLAEIVNELPFLQWVHSVTAGVEHFMCPEIRDNEGIVVTNAKGVFSSSLGEYVMAACGHFSKSIPRLMKQKDEKKWEQFAVTELKGQTMGVIGFGDIGKSCAKLAKAYGMKVLGVRRNPDPRVREQYADKVFGVEGIAEVMQQSDYLVVAMPLTPETKGLLSADVLKQAKKGMVFINVGRGALVDETALISMLEDGTQIVGAALDVFTVEPLPQTSKLWSLPNVLISPHNADILHNSRHRSVKFFTDNVKNYISGEDLEMIVDKTAGY